MTSDAEYAEFLKGLAAIDPRLGQNMPKLDEPRFIRDMDRVGNPMREALVKYLRSHNWQQCTCANKGWFRTNSNIRTCVPIAMAYAAEKSVR